MEPEEVERLIREKQLGPLQGFRSRQGRPFAAVIRLNAEHKLEFDFGNQPKDGDGGSAQPVDFAGKEPIGKCPKCGGRVFDNGIVSTPTYIINGQIMGFGPDGKFMIRALKQAIGVK